MAIVAHALTTVARVKARLDLTETTWDALFAEMINGATDAIEAFVGRRFATAAYTNEIYSPSQGRSFIYLRHWPVTAISSVQYRAGTPDVPNWTSLLPSEYELKEDGRQGTLRLYTAIHGTNSLRITYTAGYTIGFIAGDTQLPFSVIDICERMVVHRFKKRAGEGKTNEVGAESSVTWMPDEIPAGDQKTLRQFQRPIFC